MRQGIGINLHTYVINRFALLLTMKNYPSTLFFTLLALILAFAGCKDKNNGINEGDVVFSGQLRVNQQEKIILEELTPSDLISIDTLLTDNKGNFSYTLYLENAGFYRLRPLEGQFITLAAEPNEKIFITADFENIRGTYEVTGSYGSEILWKLTRKQQEGMRKADSLRAVFRENRFEPGFDELRNELKTEYNRIKEEQVEFALRIIDENPNSLASILALYQFFEDKRLISESENFKYFKRLSRSLCSSYPSNKHVINLKKRVNDFKREEQQRLHNEENLAVGRVAPDITLPDPNGNQRSLSSLEGNVVLIDFWAAWCPPCREANAILGELYEQYQDQGFEIFAVSLDRTKEQWTNAIEKDNITWLQVSDLRFMNSPVVDLYSITEVPHYVLIDRERRIISRNFSIAELESLLLENL